MPRLQDAVGLETFDGTLVVLFEGGCPLPATCSQTVRKPHASNPNNLPVLLLSNKTGAVRLVLRSVASERESPLATYDVQFRAPEPGKRPPATLPYTPVTPADHSYYTCATVIFSASEDGDITASPLLSNEGLRLTPILPFSSARIIGRTLPGAEAILTGDGTNRHLFVSHAAADDQKALKLVEAIERTGKRCWIAPRDVRAGRDFREEIVAAIQKCDAMIVLISENANGSEHVLRELGLAEKFKKPIKPVRLDESELAPAFEYQLHAKHWVRFEPSFKFVNALIAG